jgi:hypothetical protein
LAQAAADAVFVLHEGNAHNLVLFLDCKSENNTLSNLAWQGDNALDRLGSAIVRARQ